MDMSVSDTAERAPQRLRRAEGCAARSMPDVAWVVTLAYLGDNIEAQWSLRLMSHRAKRAFATVALVDLSRAGWPRDGGVRDVLAFVAAVLRAKKPGVVERVDLACMAADANAVLAVLAQHKACLKPGAVVHVTRCRELTTRGIAALEAGVPGVVVRESWCWQVLRDGYDAQQLSVTLKMLDAVRMLKRHRAQADRVLNMCGYNTVIAGPEVAMNVLCRRWNGVHEGAFECGQSAWSRWLEMLFPAAGPRFVVSNFDAITVWLVPHPNGVVAHSTTQLVRLCEYAAHRPGRYCTCWPASRTGGRPLSFSYVEVQCIYTLANKWRVYALHPVPVDRLHEIMTRERRLVGSWVLPHGSARGRHSAEREIDDVAASEDMNVEQVIQWLRSNFTQPDIAAQHDRYAQIFRDEWLDGKELCEMPRVEELDSYLGHPGHAGMIYRKWKEQTGRKV